MARALTDPLYAHALALDPARCLSFAGLPPDFTRQLGQVSAEAWTQQARQYDVRVGPDISPHHTPPTPHDLVPIPRLAAGRRLSLGRKYRVEMGHRTVPIRETIRRAERIERTIGITRLSKTTGVDRIGIPVWAAIRPDHRSFSVFNGKGLADAHARAGAYMEAIERYCAEHRPPGARIKTTRETLTAGPLVTPPELRLVPPEAFDLDQAVEWTKTWDLLNEEAVWMPTAATMFPYRPLNGAAPFPSSTNGLASGNTLEEAMCHGLAELIERDAYSLVAVTGYLAAVARALAQTMLGDPPARRTVVGRFPEHLDLRTVPMVARRCVERFRSAGTQISVLDMTSDLGIPAFLALAVDPHVNHEWFSANVGLGAHPTASVALTRALTEAAQSRVTGIQGAREDLPAMLREEYFHCIPSPTRGPGTGAMFPPSRPRRCATTSGSCSPPCGGPGSPAAS